MPSSSPNPEPRGPGTAGGADTPSPPPRILKKFAYLLSARWVRDAFQTVFLIYLARISTTTYGEFMLALGLGSILLLVSEFGLNLPLVTLLTRKGRDSGEALSQVTILKGILLLLALGGVVVFIEWQGYPPPLQRLLLLLSAGAGLEALASTFFVALQVKGRQDLEGKVRALAAGLGFGYGLLALILGAPPLAVAAFKLIESLVNLGGGAALALSWGRFRLHAASLRGLGSTLRLGLVFALMEVASITYNKANLFFLQKYAGAHGVAQYSATWNLVDGISALASSLLLQSILYPLFVQLWQTDRSRVPALAQNTARWLLAAALAVMFVLGVESDRLIPLIYGPHYLEAVHLQHYLVVTVVFAFLHNLSVFLMLSMHLERLLLLFYLGGLAGNLLWCSLALPQAPLLGAALAMVLTKGGVALLTVSYTQRHVGLFSAKPLKQLGAVTLAGAALYLLTCGYLAREIAEILALTPLLGLAWHWWRRPGE
jgi:O-antigen/teichoic acid export membrane protein